MYIKIHLKTIWNEKNIDWKEGEKYKNKSYRFKFQKITGNKIKKIFKS